MKWLLLVLVLKIVIESESSNDLEDIKWNYMKYDYIHYKDRNKYPLKSFLRYNDIRNDINNLVVLQFPELHCNIKDICTFCKVDAKTKYGFKWFCKLYYDFEHKSKFVFLVNNFDSWFLYPQNITIHSDQDFSNTRNIFFNTR